MKAFVSTLIIAASLSTSAWAETTSESLHTLQKNWAEINYMMSDKEKEEAFAQLITDAEKQVKAHPDQAEYQVWLGIIQSSTAGAKGGLGALSLAKAAKQSFENAIEQDPSALHGSAYTSLGVLYHKVPGWPLGFGSDKKAKKLLNEALKQNPDGIDSNYFYAEFLYDDDQYQEAKQYLLKAQSATPRPDRPLADKGRHQEIDALMAKINKKLK